MLSHRCNTLRVRVMSDDRRGGRPYRTHGDSGSVEYATWANMLHRCQKESAANYHSYGGRGISVCQRWQTYENFLADMGRRPSSEHSLERVNVNGNYEPGNCIWATKEVQVNNTTRNVVHEVNGRRLTNTQLAKELNVAPGTIAYRLKQGLSIDEVVGAGTSLPGTYEYLGEQLTIREISRRSGIAYHTLYKRLKYQKLSVTEAVKKKSGS